MPELTKIRRNLAGKVVPVEFQNPEVRDLREGLRNGAHEEVLRQFEVLEMLTRGEIGWEGGVDEVVEEREARERGEAA